MAAGALRIHDLEQLEGDVLLFGGPYSNLHAFRALLEMADERRIEAGNRICTGDLIAYCANPSETIELLKDQAHVIAGNCEKQIVASAPDCGCGFAPGSTCDSLSKGWFGHCGTQVTGRQRDYLAGLPDVIVFEAFARRYAVLHGGISNIARFLWPDSPDPAFREEIERLVRLTGPVHGIVAGHCGIAFERRVAGVHWINPGAIGLPPNDGGQLTRFAVLTGDGLEFLPLRYDARAASAAMKAAGLTQGYEKTLIDGWWPSEDILPPSLRRQPSRASG